MVHLLSDQVCRPRISPKDPACCQGLPEYILTKTDIFAKDDRLGIISQSCAESVTYSLIHIHLASLPALAG